MPITINITGDNADEVARELHDISEALHAKQETSGKTEVAITPSAPVPAPAPAAPAPAVPVAPVAPTTAAVTPAPPPSAAQAAAQETAPAPAAPAPVVEVDTRGYAWDARIHTKAKTKMANGNWKKARGTDAALVTQVEAELAAAAVAPATPENIEQAPVTAPTPAGEMPPIPPSLDRTAEAPATPAPAPAPAAPVAGATYAEVAAKMSNAIQAQLISPPDCEALLQKHGVSAIPELVSNTAALAILSADLDAHVAAVQAANA